jgi:hypothetical protein
MDPRLAYVDKEQVDRAIQFGIRLHDEGWDLTDIARELAEEFPEVARSPGIGRRVMQKVKYSREGLTMEKVHVAAELVSMAKGLVGSDKTATVYDEMTKTFKRLKKAVEQMEDPIEQMEAFEDYDALDSAMDEVREIERVTIYLRKVLAKVEASWVSERR